MTYTGRSEWSSFGCWSLFCSVQDILVSDLYTEIKGRKTQVDGVVSLWCVQMWTGGPQDKPMFTAKPSSSLSSCCELKTTSKTSGMASFCGSFFPSGSLASFHLDCETFFIFFSSPISLWCFVTAWYCRCRNWCPLCWESRSNNGFPCSSLE